MSGEALAAEVAELRRRVRRLETIEEIRGLKHRYAQACDNGYDGARFAELFTANGTWTSNTIGTVTGHAELAAFIDRAGVTEFSWAIHYMTCMGIDLAPDATRAHGTWQLLQLATSRDGAEPLLATAIYEDDLVHDGDGWKFETVRVRFHHVVDVRQGWRTAPLAATR